MPSSGSFPSTPRPLATAVVLIGVVGIAGVTFVAGPWALAAAGAGAVVATGIAVLAGRRAVPAPAPDEPTPGRATLEDALVRAGQLESLGMLAGGIAHDFNNLLMGILGNAGVALDEVPDGPAKDAIRDVEVAARRGRDLVAHMLAYSGKGRLEARPIDVGEVVSETVTVLGRVLDPNAAVELSAPAGMVVEADPTLLRQVVMNLLTNASDALGGAPGRIGVVVAADDLDRTRLDGTAHGRELPPGRYVRVGVSDTGCGMDPDTVRRMFEPFFTTKFTGRGLGLAALLGIVRNHRGTVLVESALGSGTRVHVWLPLLEDVAASHSETPRMVQRVDHTGTVLLAEDEEVVRRVTTRMLSKLGFDVVAVKDGEEALRALDDEELVLAVLDVQMPGVDGAQVLKGIRERRAGLPVVLMTGYAGPANQGATPDAWLKKPFSLKDLVRAIESARSASAPRAQPPS